MRAEGERLAIRLPSGPQRPTEEVLRQAPRGYSDLEATSQADYSQVIQILKSTSQVSLPSGQEFGRFSQENPAVFSEEAWVTEPSPAAPVPPVLPERHEGIALEVVEHLTPIVAPSVDDVYRNTIFAAAYPEAAARRSEIYSEPPTNVLIASKIPESPAPARPLVLAPPESKPTVVAAVLKATPKTPEPVPLIPTPLLLSPHPVQTAAPSVSAPTTLVAQTAPPAPQPILESPPAVVVTRATPSVLRDHAIDMFFRDREVSGVQTQTLSYEGQASSRFGRWILVSGPSIRSTLVWDLPERGDRFPVLSKSAETLLSLAARVSLLNTKAHVYARILKGWTVDILQSPPQGGQSSGRSDLRWGDDLKPVQSAGSEISTPQGHLLAANLEPGIHLVSVVEHSTGRRGVVTVVLLPGVVTAIDLTSPQTTTVTGQVLTADLAEAQAFDLRLSVPGRPEISTRLGAEGRFDAGPITTFGSAPIHVELSGSGVYTQRLRVFPDELSRLRMFALSQSMVNAWTQQLAGGVDPQTGIFVGGLPELASLASKTRGLYAEVSRWNPESGQWENAETYTLTVKGQMVVQQPLSPELPRFVGVQVPPGLARAVVRDAQGQVVWMRLEAASPSVLNVIGPVSSP